MKEMAEILYRHSNYANSRVDSDTPQEAQKVTNATCQRVTEHCPNFEPVQFWPVCTSFKFNDYVSSGADSDAQVERVRGMTYNPL